MKELNLIEIKRVLKINIKVEFFYLSVALIYLRALLIYLNTFINNSLTFFLIFNFIF